jgi:hypothetical protein
VSSDYEIEFHEILADLRATEIVGVIKADLVDIVLN